MKAKIKNNVISLHSQEAASPSFNRLAESLSQKLDDIESQFKEGVEALEDELKEMARVSKINKKEWQQEMKALTQIFESRIQKSLKKVAQAQPKGEKRSEVDFINSLTLLMSQFLSGEFFRTQIKSNISKKIIISEEVDDFGVDQNFRLKLKPFFDFLYYKYWRVQTTGIENIPSEGRALLVGNHSGALPYDGAMLGVTILNEHPVRQDARFLVEDFVYYMPFLGSTMYRLGGIRACPENAERVLEAGHLLVVFPEGVKGLGKYYKDRYKLQRFGRGGFIRLCIKTKSPLIPVAIVGAEEIHPIIYKSNALAKLLGVPYVPITPTFPTLGLLGLIPMPSQWSIHFGKPFDFEKTDLSILDDGITIHKLTEEVRGTIQNILNKMLQHKGNH